MRELLKFSAKPKLRKPTLVVGWESDGAQIGLKLLIPGKKPQCASFL